MITCVGPLIVMFCFPPDAPKTQPVYCPPLVGWSATDQKAASNVLKNLPAGHPLRKMAVVTIDQRKLIRACQGQGK